MKLIEKILNKSNSYTFYKNNFNKLINSNKVLNDKINSLISENDELLDKINEKNNYIQFLEELLVFYSKKLILDKICNNDFSNLNIVIKSPNPKNERHWGDYFFSIALKKSFEKKGFNVIIQEREEWYDKKVRADINIILRGLVEYKPNPNEINIMWNISHPNEISFEEYELYDICFISSVKYAKLVQENVDVNVEPLLQCTDPDVFYREEESSISEDILFVGVTRGVYRKIVRDVLKTDFNVSIYGKEWNHFIDKKYIKGDFIPNEELHKYYSSCKILLNDHWDDMCEMDFPSNRLFDALACETFIISDKIPSASTLFEGNIVTYDDVNDLNKKLEYYLNNETERKEKAKKGKEIVLKYHTFDNRVDKIINCLKKSNNDSSFYSKFNNNENYIYHFFNDKKKILYVLHSGSGGTPKTVNDIVKNIHNQYECYLLTSDSKVMKLFKYTDKFELVETYNLYSKWFVEKCYIEEYSKIYLKILSKYKFDIVHIHHLIFHSFDLPKLCKHLNIPVILSIHDFYFICPAYTLLDGDFKYCSGYCSNSNSDFDCFMPMKNITEITNMKTYVKDWKKIVSDMFSSIDFFIVPSEFIKNIFKENYKINENRLNRIEHGIDNINLDNQLFEVPDVNKPTKILFLGNLYPQKGVPIIKELYELDVDNKLEFHFLGFVPDELKNIGINHGSYDIYELKNYLKEIKPSFVGIFTLCGESYCYTLSESWLFGIPVLASKLGALEERILENGGGWFIDIDNMKKSYQSILKIIKNTDEYLNKQNEIKNIKLNSTKSMAKNYLLIYDNLFNADR